MSRITRKTLVLLFCLATFYTLTQAQSPNQGARINGLDTSRNPINTAVPFLLIAPDGRASGMGDVGVATSPDVNSIHWNAAKLAFIEDTYGFSLSYSPWLRNIGINDMFLAYLSGFYKFDKRQAFGMSLRYFNLGNITFTDINGNPIRDFNPNEFALDASYSRQLSEKLSVAVTGRFIHSNLTGDLLLANQQESRAGNTGAADLGIYYANDKLKVGGMESKLAFGANISNIGAKISYIAVDERADFLPTNLRLGGAFTTSLDPLNYNKLTFAIDFNKLLVPTPNPEKADSNITVLSGIFRSFGDAPGGFKEELQEITIGMGLEYWYNNIFSARMGYFTESPEKGNRKYLSLGAGIRYQQFGLDVSYLIGTQKNGPNPLAETLRFTVLVNFDKKKNTTATSSSE